MLGSDKFFHCLDIFIYNIIQNNEIQSGLPYFFQIRTALLGLEILIIIRVRQFARWRQIQGRLKKQICSQKFLLENEETNKVVLKAYKKIGFSVVKHLLSMG